ncbi:gamma-glutamyl-gamma-aminobutyrate hydrolase family protein [Leucobacter sp. UCMA 4100]|uniref:gamma-glutamyl-gamma-aminobutyrate hydrolase family protein n=1 Tax=Leucobacter sp. UCMA 4100 TaxID=2810534 RepID=UPI0022EA33B5|nr:gamma-glutamyl-gamma-aminobutyrate hydrolase family protein [Leucobacter sp. UCMA 4100]MDA3146996.1 gamma-glutamyl-gamma-aminobutyrate hydrolase family protein [Leucobacter sp. UCMA 4100]
MPEGEFVVAVPRRPEDRVAEEGSRKEEGNYPKVLACLREVGLTPIVVGDTSADVSGIDAVLIPGGGDIDPLRYGGEHTEKVYGVDQNQDEVDFWMVSYALEHGLPLMGICRGAQLINVAHGGTLYEDLPEGSGRHHNNISEAADSSVFVEHRVTVDPESLVAESLGGATEAMVRSAHHQCVRDLGEGLRVVARAEDGTVEAFEGEQGWLIGVQWHPEAEREAGLVKYGQFEAFAAAIRKRAEVTNHA